MLGTLKASILRVVVESSSNAAGLVYVDRHVGSNGEKNADRTTKVLHARIQSSK